MNGRAMTNEDERWMVCDDDDDVFYLDGNAIDFAEWNWIKEKELQETWE